MGTQPARFAARTRAIFDAGLHHSSAVIYAALDEYARFDGRSWPRQGDLAIRLGMSRRTVQRGIEQLIELGYVTVKRGRYSNTYQMVWWKSTDAPSVSHLEFSDASPVTPQMRHQLRMHIRKKQDNETEVPPLSPLQGERTMKCFVCRGRGQRPGAIRGTCPGCSGSGEMAVAS